MIIQNIIILIILLFIVQWRILSQIIFVCRPIVIETIFKHKLFPFGAKGSYDSYKNVVWYSFQTYIKWHYFNTKSIDRVYDVTKYDIETTICI